MNTVNICDAFDKYFVHKFKRQYHLQINVKLNNTQPQNGLGDFTSTCTILSGCTIFHKFKPKPTKYLTQFRMNNNYGARVVAS